MTTFDATIDTIREQPWLPRVVYRELPNVKTAVFPYPLWYRMFEEIELIEVVAVLHTAQDWTRLDRR